jgi:hypothetical protein
MAATTEVLNPMKVVDSRLTRVWNWAADIQDDVQLSSYDRPGFSAPPFGQYIEVEKYHADNLCERNPGFLTQDEALVKRMVAARNNLVAVGDHFSPLDLFTEEQLQEALEARTLAATAGKPKGKPGRPPKNKSDGDETSPEDLLDPETEKE